jgi:hypothetical protein
VLDLATVDALRSVALRFGAEHRASKARALAAAASSELAEPKALLAYHDCLLCLAAYPETRELLATTRRELRRVAAAAHELYASGPARVRAKLANTGVAGTEVTINFGWDIARWLVARFPREADLDSFGEGGVPPAEILAESLAPMEFELGASDADALEFDRPAKRAPPEIRLAWLVDAFRALAPAAMALRATLWDAMRAFIVIRTGRSLLSRTFAARTAGADLLPSRGLPETRRPPARSSTNPCPAARRLERTDASTWSMWGERARGPRPRKPTRSRSAVRKACAGTTSRGARRSRSTRSDPNAAPCSTRTSA